MKRVFFSIFAAGLLMTTVCNGASVMTMTTSSANVKILLVGSGAVTIDWGDGSEIITGTLEEYNRRWWHKREYSHNYADESSRTITVTGENVTHIRCDGNHLTNLDVSKNTALTHMECRFNRLASLDVSKNTNLLRLICQGNELKSLDVSNNILLTGLDCSFNQLKNLDVSNNTSLTRLSCACNPLNNGNDALNDLFGTLNGNAEKKIILIGRFESEEVSCNESIAKKNGWTIEKPNYKKSRKTGKPSFFIPDIV